ncbi:MAG: acyltransferase family protein [Deltaproteobacteria bacterium]|nr:acyltransferase family protein [Deltaproteobacteria bacterium]
MSLLYDDEVLERLERLELPFNRLGVDPYGVTKRHLALAFSLTKGLYRNYFGVSVQGAGNVPARGRAMLIGNHSGGVAIDGLMVILSMFWELDPPRLAQGMVEKFLNRVAFASLFSNRTGQFTGLPEHCVRLLEDERLLMVFPEGARGTAKLYRERHSLVNFGTGFLRLALKARAPIVPFAFLGGGEAFPTVWNSQTLGRLVGAPYVPITAYLAPIPLPVSMEVYYGEPLRFPGDGDEDDPVIQAWVDQVKDRIRDMIAEGCRRRGVTPALGDGGGR